MNLQLLETDVSQWVEVKDGDPRAVAIYKRHYSCNDTRADLVRYGFSGQGESMILHNKR